MDVRGIIDNWAGTALALIPKGRRDRVVISFLLGLLEDVEPEECYRYIVGNIPLVNTDTSMDWQKYGQWARECNLDSVNTERILLELEKHRPDLHQFLTDCPGGVAWLDRQVKDLRIKLSIDNAPLTT